MKSNARKNQKGAVLAVGLLVLLVITLIGVTGMINSNMQEEKAGNVKKEVEARLGAEAGIADAIAFLKKNPDTGDAWSENTPITDWAIKDLKSQDTNLPYSVKYDVNFCADSTAGPCPSAKFTPGSPPSKSIKITSIGSVVSSLSTTLSQATISIVYNSCNTGELKYALQAKERIIFSGGGNDSDEKGVIKGNIYTGSTLSGNGPSNSAANLANETINGSVTALGGINNPDNATGKKYYPGSDDGEPTAIDIPSAATALPGRISADLASGKLASATSIDCSTLNGDLGGKSYVCSTPATGNKALKNDFFNGKLYFDGAADIDFSGGVGLGQAGKPVEIIATGDITFAGGDKDSWYTIWTDGDYRHNGGRNIYGSIRVGGTIDWNGTSNFTGDDFGEPISCTVTVGPSL